MESDSLMLIDQILEVHSAPDWLIEAEVVTIRQLLDTHCRWNLRWVSRDCNVLAHNLANWGLYSGMLRFSIVMRCRMIYLVVTALPGSAERICNGNPCLLGKKKKRHYTLFAPHICRRTKRYCWLFFYFTISLEYIWGRARNKVSKLACVSDHYIWV